MRREVRVRVCCVGALGVMSILTGTAARASGFQLQEQTASGLGIAYSGMAAATQDAGTVFWNPAGMSFMSGSDFSVAVQYIRPSFSFNSAGSTYDVLGNGGDGGVSAWVPALYARTTLNPKLSVGLAVNVPFGLSTNWIGEWVGTFHANKSYVETVNINPAVSYKVTDFLSVAAGVSYQYLKAIFTNGVTPLIPSAQGRLEGDDWTWGWNLGALADFGQGTRLGVTYRSTTSYHVDATLSFNNPALAPLASGAEAGIRLPDVFSVGVSHQFTSRVRVLADYTRTGWNTIRSLTVVATSGPNSGQPVLNDALNFDNSWRLGVGAEYQLNRPWLLRLGVAYDRTPVSDTFRTPRLPDEDRKWLAFGARYTPDTRWSVDFGYAYLWVQDGRSELTPPGPVPGSLVGTYNAKTSILGIQASYHL